MDKKIEEMAKDMLEYGMEKYPTGESVFTETKLREQFYHVFLTYAEYLINKGYRKIPEGVVVLTREDYDYLINDCQRWENLAVEKVDEINKTSKETAEKIMNNISGDVLVVDTKEYGRIEVVPLERLDEITNEFMEGKV